MNGWTAVLPIKRAADRKTRLAGVLSVDERVQLTDQMLRRAFDVLDRASLIAEVATLSFEPLGRRWFDDLGRGLNEELARVAQAVPDRLLVLNPDLPAISTEDVEALLEEAGDVAAIAPDRHRRGTNALALAHADPTCFAFGPDSFARHRGRLRQASIVARHGLALDIDLPADLAEGRRFGLFPPDFP